LKQNQGVQWSPPVVEEIVDRDKRRQLKREGDKPSFMRTDIRDGG